MSRAYLIDMDGVLITGSKPIPGAVEFITRLHDASIPFMVFTNNSRLSPRDHHARLSAMGLNIPEEQIFTSALATAYFLDQQRPKGSAYVIGESGLTTALHEIGYVQTEHDPDYFVLGETKTYNFESLTTAIRLITGGARFIATNPDVTGPGEGGTVPATVLRGQAQPADDARGAAPDRRALGKRHHGRRPHGHRHRRRDRERPGDDPGAQRRDQERGSGALPLHTRPDPGVGGRHQAGEGLVNVSQ
jgi:hypothetical protein